MKYLFKSLDYQDDFEESVFEILLSSHCHTGSICVISEFADQAQTTTLKKKHLYLATLQIHLF